MSQWSFHPTRGQSILDLVLTNNKDIIQDTTVGEAISDHNVVTFNINVHPSCHKASKKLFYNIRKADWAFLNEFFMNIPWNCAYVYDDIDEIWNAWSDLFLTAVDQPIP